MNIVLNGENRSLTASTSLAQLVAELGFENKRLAIEVNEEIIPRSQHAEYMLQENDRVEIVQAIGGGAR